MSYLGEEIKKLGFGLMRLPQKAGRIDIEQTKTMVDLFLEAGFTYFDTAWAYAGSEDAIRQALVERYPRESFQLATKNAAWINCKTREEAIAQFDVSLKQTGAGYFDFYLLHNLGEGRTHFFDDFDMWSFVQEKKKEGLIKHAGFSFEKEARLIAIDPNANSKSKNTRTGICISNIESQKMIKRILINPYAPKWFEDLVIEIISNRYNLQIPVYRSTLAEG